jgi:cell division protease FtsH
MSPQPTPNRITTWVIVTFVLFGLYRTFFVSPPDPTAELPTTAYSELYDAVQNDKVARVEIRDNLILGVLKKGEIDHMSGAPVLNTIPSPSEPFQFKTVLPPNPQALLSLMVEKRVRVSVRPESTPNAWWGLLYAFGPMALFVAFIWWQGTKQTKNGNTPFSFSKSKAKEILPEQHTVTWDDVKGINESKEELKEIVDFLKNPSKFKELGGRIPKGVLLVGSPGCGKTHLSRALATEAGASFFSLSGSDFVEMFVGVGASRVKDLFTQARAKAPSIIFIDEIDSVGRQRGAGIGIGHDEREQTLNALLVEMDGFDQEGGVIVVAATNRPDVLDSALLRPGRFDRQIVVPNPDILGRKEILELYTKKLPLSASVDVQKIARNTPGFSGADLANLVNEASLCAARLNKKQVDALDFESAKDKILMGAERKHVGMTMEERQHTAFHEAGHAVINLALPHTDPIHKVTIVPRGRALGVTATVAERDKYSESQKSLQERLVMMFGGRAAEEIFFDQFTTGASNDIKQATDLARLMVTSLGMSPLGPIRYSEDDDSMVFLGRSMGSGAPRQWSSSTLDGVDAEIQRLLRAAYAEAKRLVLEHRNELEIMANLLLDQETLNADECVAIMKTKHRAATVSL